MIHCSYYPNLSMTNAVHIQLKILILHHLSIQNLVEPRIHLRHHVHPILQLNTINLTCEIRNNQFHHHLIKLCIQTFSYIARVERKAMKFDCTQRKAHLYASSSASLFFKFLKPSTKMYCIGGHTFGKSHCSPLFCNVLGTPPTKVSSLLFRM